MPYICLAQDLPDGTLNVLDLFPNTSLRNLILDPQGQTKYVNRAENDPIVLNDANGNLLSDARGLSAYLTDAVEPGGSEVSVGTVLVSTSVATNTVTIGGVAFLAVAGGAVAANQEFDDTANAGSDILSAASLVATVNDAASQALIAGLNAAVVVTAANGGTATVTLTASVAGPTGDLTLATNSAGTLVLSGTALARTNALWTAANLAVATAALLARVDGGLGMLLTDVNTILGGYDAELTGATTNSTGTLAEILSLLAGRGYIVRAGSSLYTGTVFNTARVGGFTENVLTFDPEFNASPNGTLVPREVKPIRHTYDTGALQESALLGHLGRFANGVTLFPDSDVLPPIPGQQAPILNARVVTVYADDGTVLA